MPTTLPNPSSTFEPLFPEPIDQGDPYILRSPTGDAMYHYYVYTTGEETTTGRAFPVYGSHDLHTWHALGPSLEIELQAAHWAPCVTYVPDVPRPYVMLYSRSVGIGDLAHVGHQLWRADSERPEGPFVPTGALEMPACDFAIDPDVFRSPDGSMRIAFAVDFVRDQPYGTGLVEATIDASLTRLTSEPHVLSRPSSAWHVYDEHRSMPWKTIPGVDWATQTVQWHTMEAPVGGLISPTGETVYLYSGGSFSDYYAVGALIDVGGDIRDVTLNDHGFVLKPDAARNFYAPGHCSLLRTGAGRDYLMFHARFGSLTAKRQMSLALLQWNERGLPYGVPCR